MTQGSSRHLTQRVATIVIGATLVGGCAPPASDDAGAQRLADREAIEQVLARRRTSS